MKTCIKRQQHKSIINTKTLNKKKHHRSLHLNLNGLPGPVTRQIDNTSLGGAPGGKSVQHMPTQKQVLPQLSQRLTGELIGAS